MVKKCLILEPKSNSWVLCVGSKYDIKVFRVLRSWLMDCSSRGMFLTHKSSFERCFCRFLATCYVPSRWKFLPKPKNSLELTLLLPAPINLLLSFAPVCLSLATWYIPTCQEFLTYTFSGSDHSRPSPWNLPPIENLGWAIQWKIIPFKLALSHVHPSQALNLMTHFHSASYIPKPWKPFCWKIPAHWAVERKR